MRDIRGTRPLATGVPDEEAVDLPVRIPEPPEHLSADEIDVFVDTARKLAGMRVMTEADVDALSIFARNWVIARDAHRRVYETGGIIVRSPNGHGVQNPYYSVARKAEDRCMKILAEFGLTPSSRTRVGRSS